MPELPRPWVRLDNAALLFPSVTSDRLTHLFRLAVRLKAPVQRALLLKALHEVLPRFPSFRVRLEPGLFWYSLVEELSLPTVYPDTVSPAMPFRRRLWGPHLFRVRWFGRRLAVEFSHALTDGVGGLTFLKALAAEYLHQSGVAGPAETRRAHQDADPAEATDEFQPLYDPRLPRFEAWSRAYRPTDALRPKGQYAVTTGRLSVAAMLAASQARGATLTEYLAATLLDAFQTTFWERPHRRARPFRLVIPVNLRAVFPSKTLRNFFVVVPVEIDPRLGRYEFDEILRKVHHQLQSEMDAKLLKKQVVRNLRGELNPVARLLPLPLKNLVLSAVYGSFERQHTASLSNLGRADWPAEWAAGIEDVEFTPPASPYCRVNAGVVSCGDTLSVTFGNSSVSAAVERAFFTRLRREGLAVFIESNRSFLEV